MLDVRLIQTDLNFDGVKHMEHNVATCLRTLLENGNRYTEVTHWNLNKCHHLVFSFSFKFQIYRQVSNIRHTLVGNLIVDHSDAVGASPVGAAPTTSLFSTWHLV